jgi:predicted acetyltransferase
VAATPEAHRGLIGHLASLADQVREIQYAAPADQAWLAILRTPQNLRPGPEIGLFNDTGNLGHGAMLRLTDVKLALETFPVAPHARGEIVLEVNDAVIPANARPYRVSAREGRLKVRPETGRAGARPRLPRLVADADALGPLISGLLSPMRAADVGLVDSADGAAEVIESWFRGRPAFLYQMNAF